MFLLDKKGSPQSPVDDSSPRKYIDRHSAGNYTERSRSIPRASSVPKRNDVLKISRISTDNASQSKYLNLQYKLSLNNS